MATLIEKIKFLQPAKIAGVDLFMTGDGYKINAVVLSRKKSEVTVEKITGPAGSFTELKQMLDANTPLIINLDGKGVIHRQVRRDEDTTIEEMVGSLLPNSDLRELYYQVQPLSEDTAFVSVVRKELIEQILAELKKEKLSLTGLFLGPVAATTVFELIPGEDEILTSHFILTRHGKNEFGIEKNDAETQKQYHISNEEIPSENITGFASALTNFMQAGDVSSNFMNLMTSEKEEFLYSKAFRLLGRGSLAFFLGLLLINFIFFSYYHGKYPEKKMLYDTNAGMLEELKQVRDEYNSKKKYLLDNRMFDASRFSYYADRIAFRMPEAIKLTDIRIFPVKTRMRQGQEFRTAKNIIIVAGKSKPVELNEYIEALNKEEWIASVEINSYINDDKSAAGEFEIEIKIKR